MPLKNKRIDWNNPELLQKAISTSTSMADTLRTLNYSPSGPTIKKLKNAIKKFNLDLSTFTVNAGRWEDLPNIIKECSSMPELLKKMGLQIAGGSRKTARKYIKKFNLNVDHFDMTPCRRKYKNEELFCKNCTIHRSTVKDYIINYNLIKYECSKCGNMGSWLNEKLTLQIEHINGTNNDNRLENLTFLCPNCHTQTLTFAGKNNRV